MAVLLPGAFYFIREKHKPPVDLFRAHGVAMALATDCNPGTSPLTSLLLTMNMAATLFSMTVEECLLGVTRHAADALGRGGPDRHAGSRKVRLTSPSGTSSALPNSSTAWGSIPLHARVWRGL